MLQTQDQELLAAATTILSKNCLGSGLESYRLRVVEKNQALVFFLHLVVMFDILPEDFFHPARGATRQGQEG